MGYGAVVTSLYVKNSYFALGGVNFELVRWEKMWIHGNNFLALLRCEFAIKRIDIFTKTQKLGGLDRCWSVFPI